MVDTTIVPDQTFITIGDVNWTVTLYMPANWPPTGVFYAHGRVDPSSPIALDFEESNGRLSRSNVDGTNKKLDLTFSAKARDIMGLSGAYTIDLVYYDSGADAHTPVLRTNFIFQPGV